MVRNGVRPFRLASSDSQSADLYKLYRATTGVRWVAKRNAKFAPPPPSPLPSLSEIQRAVTTHLVGVAQQRWTIRGNFSIRSRFLEGIFRFLVRCFNLFARNIYLYVLFIWICLQQVFILENLISRYFSIICTFLRGYEENDVDICDARNNRLSLALIIWRLRRNGFSRNFYSQILRRCKKIVWMEYDVHLQGIYSRETLNSS